jgi:hypothetical protein
MVVLKTIERSYIVNGAKALPLYIVEEEKRKSVSEGGTHVHIETDDFAQALQVYMQLIKGL